VAKMQQLVAAGSMRCYEALPHSLIVTDGALRGVNIRGATIRTGNVAAVMVTGNLPAFGTQGTRMDVTVSALGDSKNLQGGTLLVTPLLGADGNVYAVAQGSLSIGGFQAEGTRGRALQEGAKSLSLFGQNVPVLAEIVEMGQFSAHAGKSELLRWLTGLQVPPKQVYLTHGEPEAAQSLQQAITTNFKWPASVARYLDTVAIG